MWLTRGKKRKFCYKERKKGALQNVSCLSSTHKKSLNFSRQMTEGLSVSAAKSSSPSSSSYSALDNQGLDKQMSQGKKKKKKVKLCTSATGARNTSHPPEAMMREVKKVCEEELLIAVAMKRKPCSESGCSD